MDTTKLQDLRHRCQRLTQRLDAMEHNLPRDGEPPEVYAFRGQVQGDDVVSARVALRDGGEVWIVFIQTIVDQARVYEEVIQPLQDATAAGSVAWVMVSRATPAQSLQTQMHDLLSGRVLIFSQGSVASLDLKSFPQRSVGEPSTEKAILGSKQGFTESVDSNLGALRDRLRTPHLQIETFEVGQRSRTRVALVYLDDVANADLVELTRQGIETIGIADIRSSNGLAEFLFQRSLTTVPLCEQTERVDRASHAISDGRVCIVVDGTPFVVLVPTTLFETVHDTESAIPGPINVGFVRALRLLGMFVAVSAAGLYAAVLTADTPLLPTPLALAVTASRTGVPYPVLTETLLMLVIIDVFSEATSQAPGGIGNALSIVGTLIIGQMAVQARLASSLMMIVIAMTALGSFLTLKYPFSYTLRVWKYPLTLAGGLFGLFGWMAGIMLMVTHLVSLKSAGVPYMSPLAPLEPRTLIQNAIFQPSGAKRRRRPGTWDVQDIRSGGDTP